MRLVIQRVRNASVEVEDKIVSDIGMGLLILVGIEKGDEIEDMEWLAGKTVGLRIFPDSAGVMNLDVREVDGEILAVSQFTLTASTKKGNRPSYIRAAGHDEAIRMYDIFCERLSELTGKRTKRGIFGADMQVKLINDGPVTVIIDSKLRE